MKYPFILFCILLSTVTFSQTKYDPLTTPNTYNQADNPNYWKNKAPAGYWQQDVHYTIKANVDETKDIIDASEELVYWNNSPDDLNELYFHLYQNAFIPNSYCSELHQQNNKAIAYGNYEKKGLGTVVKNLKVDGKSVETILDNTILKVIYRQDNDTETDSVDNNHSDLNFCLKQIKYFILNMNRIKDGYNDMNVNEDTEKKEDVFDIEVGYRCSESFNSETIPRLNNELGISSLKKLYLDQDFQVVYFVIFFSMRHKMEHHWYPKRYSVPNLKIF